MSGPDDDELIALLGQLALVDHDALVAGTDGDRRAALLTAHAEQLADVLVRARSRADALRSELAGPDPLLGIEVAAPGPGPAGRVARLHARARAARALARFDAATARLLPALDAVRRR